jgi:hypothetical protein
MLKSMIKRLPMTGWYDPVMLVQTGIRVAISTVFGRFADRREAMAAANAIEPQPFDTSFDYSRKAKDKRFWFDFVADTGDGWNSTYAIARLLAQDEIKPKGNAGLPRGRLLVMGGDQVYPTASRQSYDDRLLGPFDTAFEQSGRWPDSKRPDLYAVPGNHDWYDGLNSFFGLFCRRRIKPKDGIGTKREGKVIGGRQTRQTRSYFAIRLPGNWWLWGTDSQLEGYIDQPQIEYFQHVASTWMKPGSRLILCVGMPSWEYVDNKQPEHAFANFSYLERLAGAARDEKGKPLGHKLKLILSGDSHHYARYVEGDRHYITCGGGGAFLHPTHHLDDRKKFDYEYPAPGIPYDRDQKKYPRCLERKATYPDRRTSWLLTLWNWAFAAKNWKFPLVLTPAYFLFIWLLHLNAIVSGRGTLAEALAGADLGEAIQTYWQLVFVSPGPVILILIALAGYRYFADVRNSAGRLAVGAIHAAAQAAAITATTCLAIDATSDWWTRDRLWLDDGGALLSMLAAAALSAIVSATVFGGYLWTSLAVFRRHWNEAFSSFAHRGYKCLLRLSISTEDGSLTVHPIGLTKVPRDRGWRWSLDWKPANPPLDPHLIEGPVRIV